MADGVVSFPLPNRVPRRDKEPFTEGGNGAPAEACDTFVAGPENRLVGVVVEAVLDEADSVGQIRKYNPILLHGPTGAGKSHLVQGLVSAYRAKWSKRRAVCMTASQWAQQWTDALEAQATDEFRRRHRGAHLLVIEDLTQLADKPKVQEELSCTIDAVLANGNRMMVTASLPPGQWPRIAPTLRSRLEGGLVVVLSPPGPAARAVLLRQLADQRGLAVDESAVSVLAEGLKGTARDLMGALADLQLQGRSSGRPVDERTVRGYLAARRGRQPVQLPEIAVATARSFSLKLAQLRSRSRSREVVIARGVAMYLARRLTDQSLGEIGKYFGGRDHTTVLHGCRRTEERLQDEPEVQQVVAQLQCKLQGEMEPTTHT
ncbi:MAG: ATP-binding protein [Pirellulales bacterium]|nr:ATP-binding protein [Pirellulales bacterium]